MVMIKDNHIDGAGSIEKTIKLVREKWQNKFKIEVETRNIFEVKQALAQKVDVIMLDNMSLETMKQAVKIIDGACLTEASGNMSLERIPQVAETGVDYISVGELTHTVKAFDFSLRKG
jgi:nicotinate-nucleotide pyrophosphorylase (carboxylating)